MGWFDPSTAEGLFAIAGAAHALLFLVLLVPHRFDRRRIRVESVWSKPLKFAASLALHFATLAVATAHLAPDWRHAAGLVGVAGAGLAAAAFEMAYITIQAGRGAESHFNLRTPFLRAMYTLMAIGAVVIVLAAAAVGVAVAAGGAADWPPAVRLGTAGGLILGTVLTLPIAFTLGGRLDRHVGTEPAGGRRLPLFGWSLEVGDLRVAHFMATHAMQALPVAALFADRLLPATVAIVAIWVTALAWTALTLELYRLALAGRPFTAIGLRWRRRRASA